MTKCVNVLLMNKPNVFNIINNHTRLVLKPASLSPPELDVGLLQVWPAVTNQFLAFIAGDDLSSQ